MFGGFLGHALYSETSVNACSLRNSGTKKCESQRIEKWEIQSGKVHYILSEINLAHRIHVLTTAERSRVHQVGHEGSRGGLAGEGFELQGGLVDEHGDAVDDVGAGGAGLAEQKSLGGVVDRVKDDHVPFKQLGGYGGGIDMRMHAHAGAIDQ